MDARLVLKELIQLIIHGVKAPASLKDLAI